MANHNFAHKGLVTAIHVGRIQALGPAGVLSAFVKSAVSGRVNVTSLGLHGDEQADLRVHGGRDKAVYGYSVENYAAWRADYPEHAAKFVAGGLGENLPIQGLDEHGVCLGDQHLIGTALLGVCQHRQPCYKFALRFNDTRVVRAMVENGRCGWYYRVIREGFMKAGDEVRLVARPNPRWPVARFAALESRRRISDDEWAELATLPGLAEQWRNQAIDYRDRKN
jgi:MOSC domain-containing protein YiiM